MKCKDKKSLWTMALFCIHVCMSADDQHNLHRNSHKYIYIYIYVLI
ncbi:hypothetical protein DsansV1_C06g0061881 [Dioscorea sansibarensis]